MNNKVVVGLLVLVSCVFAQDEYTIDVKLREGEKIKYVGETHIKAKSEIGFENKISNIKVKQYTTTEDTTLKFDFICECIALHDEHQIAKTRVRFADSFIHTKAKLLKHKEKDELIEDEKKDTGEKIKGVDIELTYDKDGNVRSVQTEGKEIEPLYKQIFLLWRASPKKMLPLKIKLGQTIELDNDRVMSALQYSNVINVMTNKNETQDLKPKEIKGKLTVTLERVEDNVATLALKGEPTISYETVVKQGDDLKSQGKSTVSTRINKFTIKIDIEKNRVLEISSDVDYHMLFENTKTEHKDIVYFNESDTSVQFCEKYDYPE